MKNVMMAMLSLILSVPAFCGAALDQLGQEGAAAGVTATAPSNPSPVMVAASYETGLIHGLSVASAVLATKTEGYGDWVYWAHHFAIRRDIAGAIAMQLSVLAAKSENRALQVQLEELAKDLRATPQTGYGDLNYWLRTVGNQDAAFKRIAERIDRLSDMISSHASGV